MYEVVFTEEDIKNPGFSHKKVLETLLNHFDIHSVLEFGSGYWSTGLFVKYDCDVTALEQGSQEWIDKVRERYGWYKHLEVIDSVGKLILPPEDAKYDMIFVDGETKFRVPCMEYAFKHSFVVVAHDYENPIYEWDKVEVPEGWVSFVDISQPVYTIVYMRFLTAMAKFKKHFFEDD